MTHPQVWTAHSLPGPTPTRSIAIVTGLDHLAFLLSCALVATLPVEPLLPHLGVLSAASWLGLAALGLLILRTLVSGLARRLSHVHAAMAAFLVWCLLSVLWTRSLPSTLDRLGSYLQAALLVWLVWESAPTPNRTACLARAYLCGTAVSALGTILAASLRLSPASVRFAAGGFDANELGLILVLSLPLAIYLIDHDRQWSHKLLYAAHLVVASVAVLLTGSRGALLALAVCLAGLILTLWRRSLLHQGFTLLALAVALAFAADIVPPATRQRLLGVGQEISSGTMTHRTSIWAAGFDIFQAHPWLGVGAGAFQVAVEPRLGRPFVAHNTFLSVAAELGMPGFLLLLFLLLALASAALSMPPPERRLWLLVLAVWTLGVSAITWEYQKITWLLFALLAAHARAIRLAPAAAHLPGQPFRCATPLYPSSWPRPARR